MRTTTTPSSSHPFVMEPAEPLHLTENQRKVIEEKYLKGSPSIEAWLGRVARNISFAELLYHPSSHLWGLFDGVRIMKQEIQPLPDLPMTRTRLFHSGLQS